METLKAIATRKATRAYKSDPVPKEKLDTILAAGCAAPVGRGDYASLHLTVVQNPENLKKISQAMAQMMNTDKDPLYGAPALVLVSAADQQAFPNIQYANTACVLENMLLAATDCGVDSVFIWGSALAVATSEELRRAVGIPAGFTPVASAALGTAAQPNPAEKELKITLSINHA
ncbi:MAG: nitroreductase family protein [Oscillospiraceae bacterium]